MIYYKIRLKDNPELFVKGTPVYHSTDGTGRIFQKIGQLRSFITQVMNSRHRHAEISNWEIVELEMVIKDIKGVHEIVTPKRIKELLMK
jgi:hypothetical protein